LRANGYKNVLKALAEDKEAEAKKKLKQQKLKHQKMLQLPHKSHLKKVLFKY